MADPRDDYWANTGRKPKKDFLPSTRNNLLDDLVKDTEEFSGLTSTAVEGMGDLMTSKVAGANTSSNGFDKGGSAVVFRGDIFHKVASVSWESQTPRYAATYFFDKDD